jgi:cell division protein FtsZ
MQGRGEAIMGIGKGSGENKAIDAALSAINNPMLEDTRIDGAKNLLINITGASGDIGAFAVQEIVDTIRESADPSVLILFGVCEDETMRDEISVTVIATNFDNGDIEALANKPAAESPRERPDVIPYGVFETLTHPPAEKAPDDTFAGMQKTNPVDTILLKPVAAGTIDISTPPYLRNQHISLR